MTTPADGAYATTVLVDGGRSRPTVPGTQIRVTFASGRVTAHAGCNTLTAAFEVVDGRLRCAPLATTLMAGPDDVMAQEQWVAALLDAGPVVRVDGGIGAAGAVTLESGERRLDLLPVTPPAGPALVGTMWRVVEVRSTAGATVVDQATLQAVRADVLLAATPGGAVMSVQTGCNLGQAAATVRGDSIAVGPMRLTRRGCSPEAAPVERAMVAVLQGDMDYSLTGDALELTAGDAELVLLLHAEPAGTRVPPTDRPAPG